MNEIILSAQSDSVRLDKFLTENVPDLTRNAAVILIESGYCKVNGKASIKNYRLKTGDEIILNIPEPKETDILPEAIPLDIKYEDDSLLVVNKPRAVVVHPANGHYTGTLVNGLMHHCGESLSGINGVIRPGIIHRIDKNTSGLLLIAKNDIVHNALSEQLKTRSIIREYEAVVHGNVKNSGEVNAPIGRSMSDRKKMCVTDRNSKEAITSYEVIMNYGSFTHLKLNLQTGRTHQIRVHMAYIGHPVAGDDVYGNGKPNWLGGQCLHARKLGFIHPKSGEYMEVSSELPDYFIKMLNGLL